MEYFLILLILVIMVTIPFFKNNNNKSFFVLIIVLNIVAPILIGLITSTLLNFTENFSIFSLVTIFSSLILYFGIVVLYLYFRRIINSHNLAKYIGLSIYYLVNLIFWAFLFFYIILGEGSGEGSAVGFAFALIMFFMIGLILALVINIFITIFIYRRYFKNDTISKQYINNNQTLQQGPTQSVQNIKPSQNNSSNQIPRYNRIPNWILVEITLAIFLILTILSIYVLSFIDDRRTFSIPKHTSISTTNWTTYTDNETGINFKYPSEWQKIKDENEFFAYYITQKNVEEDILNSFCSNDIYNLIVIEKIPDDKYSYDKNLELFQLLDNKEQGEIYKDVNNKYAKIESGKVLSNQQYIMYISKSTLGFCDENFIRVSILNNNSLYNLTLRRYDDEGVNVLYSLIPTIRLE